MPSVKTPFVRAAALVLAVSLLLVVAGLLTEGPPPASAATTGGLQQQIAAGQSRVSGLSSAVGSASGRVQRLGAGVASLQQQVDRLQADLNAKRAELLSLQSQLAAAHKRLGQLQAAEAHSELVLSQQLVGSYETDRPDVVSVVLESTGFKNLLERLAFAQRIKTQDSSVVGQVKAARRAVAAEATRLGALWLRQERLATAVINERDSVDRSRMTLLSEQIAATRVRDAKAGQLASARQSVSALRAQLAGLRAAQAAQAARAAQAAARSAAASSNGSGGAAAGRAAPSAGSPASGPTHSSSGGGFAFPLPTSSASPPGSWSLDDGVDISAPGGTPEYAVCSGTVVLHGIGGFGPSAPVIHCDSPLSGYDYVYYGHAGPGNWTPSGTHVSQGQVISEVGYGDVGISTGPHLEIGFADSSGSPVGPSSAPAMAALLHSAYGG